MENTNQNMVKTGDENPVNRTSNKQTVKITTAVGESSFTIPEDYPQTIYLDVYGKSYKIYGDGEMVEEEDGKSM